MFVSVNINLLWWKRRETFPSAEHLTREAFISLTVLKETCFLFMLSCQWLFVAVLCLLLCSVFASHSIHNNIQNSLCFLHECRVTRGLWRSHLSVLVLLPRSLFSFSSVQSRLVSDVCVHLLSKRSVVQCVCVCVFVSSRPAQVVSLHSSTFISPSSHTVDASLHSLYIMIVIHTILGQLCPSHRLYKVCVTSLSRDSVTVGWLQVTLHRASHSRWLRKHRQYFHNDMSQQVCYRTLKSIFQVKQTMNICEFHPSYCK